MLDVILKIIYDLAIICLFWLTTDVSRKYNKIVNDLKDINDKQHNLMVHLINDLLIKNKVVDETHCNYKKAETG